MSSAEARDRIPSFLVDTLVSTNSLNEFFERALPQVAAAFDAARGILIDYRENTGRFDLLHFVGYGDRARNILQNQLHKDELKRAVDQKDPYLSESDPGRLFLPLYFTDI